MGIKIETFAAAQLDKVDKAEPRQLAWAENPAVRQLLDVVVSILAEEYIQTVKRNPDEFSHNAGTT